MKYLSQLLFFLYSVKQSYLRRIIFRILLKLEGGEFYSPTLRKIFKIYHGVEVGLYSYGCFDTINIPAGTSIGRYCSFAQGVVIMNANHPLERLSTHPFFYNPLLKIVNELKIVRGEIVIGHDVWIGRNALILPRVRCIGNGAMIGAGAVVTKDVPAYAVVAGNPAKIIRYRFSEEIQKKIEIGKWWDKPIEELKKQIEEFLDVYAEQN